MADRDPLPRWDLIPDPHERKRVATTISSHDADGIPKVDGAGELFEADGVPVQRMHNGVLIRQGSYGGPWMTEVIRALHGHHEPQEELVFHTLIERLKEAPGPHRMIEFGIYWAYYSLWFAHAFEEADVIGIEPDPNNLEVGRFNAALNPHGDRVRFLHGAIGREPGKALSFVNESDGATTEVEQYDIDGLLALGQWDSVDLILADIQGAETALLDLSRDVFSSGRVRFAVISTHHNSISGDALTHQRALAYFREMGAHVIAEHSIPESFSGDGLIVVAFREEDRDLTVPVTFARARDSIFDEVEWELDRAQKELASVRSERDEMEGRAAAAEHRLHRIEQSLPWRAARPLRAVYARARRARNERFS